MNNYNYRVMCILCKKNGVYQSHGITNFVVILKNRF